ncbi:Mobile element protein, partial [Methylomonas fluvii]
DPGATPCRLGPGPACSTPGVVRTSQGSNPPALEPTDPPLEPRPYCVSQSRSGRYATHVQHHNPGGRQL